MDKMYIKSLIFGKDGEDERLIKNGDLIDLELSDILRHGSDSDIRKVFYVYKSLSTTDKIKYSMELKCSECGAVHIEKLSKTKVIETIRHTRRDGNEFPVGLCDSCMNILEEQKIKEREESDKRCREGIIKATNNYISWYLDSNRSFKSGVSAQEKIDTIMDCSFVGYLADIEEVEKAILEMDYFDFLNTPYWDGIRNYKLKKAKYCCQLCGEKGKLNVHHKKYENHGREHLKKIADEDLIVLCQPCHEKFHDKFDYEKQEMEV